MLVPRTKRGQVEVKDQKTYAKYAKAYVAKPRWHSELTTTGTRIESTVMAKRHVTSTTHFHVSCPHVRWFSW